jgi:adenine-specific DNA-methyltransferase
MKYLGNKNRIQFFIEDVISGIDIKFDSALDLFAGTGSVSKILSRHFKSVDSVDVLYLSKILTHVKLNKTPKINDELIKKLNTTKTVGFITNHYSEKVGVSIFKEDIANHIDGCLEVLNELNGNVPESVYNFLLNSVVESADFRSNIMGSYESFYKKGWRKQALKDWSIKIPINDIQTKNEFYQMSVEDFFINNKKTYSFVYCDTPYNNRQYSSVFHVPETICNNVQILTKGKINAPVNSFKSDFSKKTKVDIAFTNLINNVSNITDNFLISYSNEGIIKIESLVEKVKQCFPNVQLHELDYRKFNTNRKNKENKVKEFLIYGKK